MKEQSPHQLFRNAVPLSQPGDMHIVFPSAAKIGRATDSIREAENWAAFYRDALDEAAIVAVTDTKGTILSVNRKFCELSGYGEDELIGANHRLLRSGVHDRAFFQAMYRTISRGNVWCGEICNRAKDGRLYWVETTIVPHRNVDGRIESYTAIRFDITPQKMAEERLLKLVNIDPLTNLPNRRRFMEVLETEIMTTKGKLAIGFLDIDHFKDINDSLGHSAGDKILIEMAERVRGALGVDDVVARLGGDEFAILLKDCRDRDDAAERIDAVYSALANPMILEDEARKVSASIGVTCFPTSGTTVNELLKNADIALYAAKGRGRSCAAFFDDAMRQQVEQRAELFQSFERGLGQGEFCVQYQPIVAVEGGRRVKLEALLRWRHPERGLLFPGDFYEALGDEHLASRADNQVLEAVLRDIQAWKRDGVHIGAVAINATTGDFRRPQFLDRIQTAIETGEIASTDLCVEITEGMVIGRQGDNILEGIERLRALGVLIAFDDFGTGFASLSHLRDIPVDIVKIDKSFVRSIEDDKQSRAIVEGVIQIAHKLGKIVVVEGVETPSQARLLRGFKCDYIQGYLMSPPLNFEAIGVIIDALNDGNNPLSE